MVAHPAPQRRTAHPELARRDQAIALPGRQRGVHARLAQSPRPGCVGRAGRREFRQFLQQFISYAITKGQTYGAALDFAPLPKVVLSAAKKAVSSL